MEFLHVRARRIVNEVKGRAVRPATRSTRPGLQPRLHVLLRPATHTYLDLDADRDFERRIVVKVNAVSQLQRAGPRRWSGELIAMGTNTDPTSGPRASTG